VESVPFETPMRQNRKVVLRKLIAIDIPPLHFFRNKTKISGVYREL
jgi:hypothetical protein